MDWKLRRFVLLLPIVVAGRETVAQMSPDVWAPDARSPQFFAVLVEDLDRSVEWYRSAFGLEERDRAQAEDDRWTIVNLSSENLWVEIIRDERAVAAERPRGFFKVGFRVRNVEDVAKRVETATEQQVRVVEVPQHGLRLIQLRDPDGNTIQLTSTADSKGEESSE